MKIESRQQGKDHDLGIKEVAAAFGLNSAHFEVKAHDQGLINHNFKLLPRQGQGYFLQRLNPQAFPNPGPLMTNIARISQHLADKGGNKSLILKKRTDGALFHTDAHGNHWRMFELIAEATAYDRPENNDIGARGAFAFADFARRLDSLPGPALNTIIEGFHDTSRRLRQFASAVAHPGREIDDHTARMIDAFEEHAPLAERLNDLPERIVHNDTKLSNVLFDTSGQTICVVDLDTTQSGLLAHDFGDMLRSALNPYAEDDPGDATLPLNIDLFSAMSRGYLRGLGDLANEQERKTLLDGLPVITYELGLRFLTDHLQGDVYFKTKTPGQNLLRARRQQRLLKTLLANWNLLRESFDQSLDIQKTELNRTHGR